MDWRSTIDFSLNTVCDFSPRVAFSIRRGDGFDRPYLDDYDEAEAFAREVVDPLWSGTRPYQYDPAVVVPDGDSYAIEVLEAVPV
jgi:hypothetical protein